VNYLYYGDNLDILRQHIQDESADLIYLDPLQLQPLLQRPVPQDDDLDVVREDHASSHSGSFNRLYLLICCGRLGSG
jgi:hypothetical protein